MEMKKQSEKTVKSGFSIKRILTGALGGLLISIVFSFLFAVLVNAEIIPFSALTIMAGITIFLGGLTAGVIGAGGGGKLIGAVLAEITLYLLLNLVGYLVFGRGINKSFTLWIIVILAVSAAIGTVVSGFIRPTKRQK